MDIQIRPMTKSDIDTVIRVIYSIDEDDAEYARECYNERGIDGDFVMINQGLIIGVVGFTYEEGTDATFWLSWTYLLEEYHGQGLGRKMLDFIIDEVKNIGGRKMFISMSDYRDPEDGRVYDSAKKLYAAAGFTEEARLQDYYNFNESQTILGMRLNNNVSSDIVDPSEDGIKLTRIFEIDETEDSYCIDWKPSGRKIFSDKDLDKMVKKATGKGAKRIFISFPSVFPEAIQSVNYYGFYQVGKLQDFYEDGVHEMQFGLPVY